MIGGVRMGVRFSFVGGDTNDISEAFRCTCMDGWDELTMKINSCVYSLGVFMIE